MKNSTNTVRQGPVARSDGAIGVEEEAEVYVARCCA